MGLELCLPRVAIDACLREQSQAADRRDRRDLGKLRLTYVAAGSLAWVWREWESKDRLPESTLKWHSPVGVIRSFE